MKKRIFITTLMAIIIGVVMFIVPKFNNEIELSAEDRRALNYEQATDEGAVEGTDFVKFSAVFLRDLNKDGVAEELLGTCKELGTSDDLYINLNVLTEGYLENAKITINGNNFFFKTEEVTNGDLKKDYVSEDTKVLEFNRIDCGTQRIIIGQVRSGIYSQGDSNSALGKNINNYTMTSTITLTGTHVDDSGNSVDIEKTIPIIVDPNIDTTNGDVLTFIDNNSLRVRELVKPTITPLAKTKLSTSRVLFTFFTFYNRAEYRNGMITGIGDA